jgi:hypothetical protein
MIDELREAVEHMHGVPAMKRLGILVSCVLTVLACTGCGTDGKCEPGSGAPEYAPAPPATTRARGARLFALQMPLSRSHTRLQALHAPLSR